jgi:hypothetical protein
MADVHAGGEVESAKKDTIPAVYGIVRVARAAVWNTICPRVGIICRIVF